MQADECRTATFKLSSNNPENIPCAGHAATRAIPTVRYVRFVLYVALAIGYLLGTPARHAYRARFTAAQTRPYNAGSDFHRNP